MPNHCTNEIYFNFKTVEDKARFLKNVKGKDDAGNESDFTFNSIIPMPDNKWDYDWCCKNWGTKWDCYDLDINHDMSYSSIGINFLTAWSPPINILQKILEDPKFSGGLEYVRWVYRDEADMFCGYLDDDCGLTDGNVDHPLVFTGTYDA